MPAEYLKVIFQVNQADLDKFNKSLKDADDAAKDVDKNLDKLGDNEGPKKMADGFDKAITAVKAFIALQIVRELSSIAIEASKVAAAGEGVRSAFANMGGTADDLKKLSAALGGTVSNIKIMEFAVRALQKGLNMDQVQKTLEFLDKQADSTGQSFEMLGEKAIKSMKDVPSFMAEVTKKTRELGEVTAETGDAYDRIAASQENLQEAFGRLVNSEGFHKVQAFFADTLDQIAEFLEGRDFGLAGKSIEELNLELAKSIDKTNTLRASRNFLSKSFGAFDNAELEKQIDEQEKLNDAIREQIALSGRITQTAKQAEIQRKEEFAASIKEQGDAAIKALRDQNDKEVADNKKKNEQILADDKKRLDQEIQDTINAKLELDKALAKQTEETGEGIDKLLGNLAKGTKGFITRRDNKNSADLESDVQSALAPIEALPDASEEVAENFANAAISVFNLVDALNGLGKDSSGSQKFFAILQGIISVLGISIPGFGVASRAIGAGLGTVGRLVNRNEGGWIPGDGPDRDSVLLHATPGEFVTRKRSAQHSPLLLDAINAGEIDDKTFKKLLNVAPVTIVNQDQVVAAIERMPQVDLYKSGSALYEVKRQASERSIARKRRLMP